MSAANLWSYGNIAEYPAPAAKRACGTQTDESAAGPTRPPATGHAATHCAQGRAARYSVRAGWRGLLASPAQKRRARGAKPTHRRPEAATAPPAIHWTKAPQPRPPKSAEAPMGQTASSHNDAPPPPPIPLTPRCGRAVRQVNDVLERGGWRVFESCDDDFTGVVSISEIRAKFIEVLRSSTTASSLSQPALDAFLACCDRGDGFVDHGGWNVLRENVARIAKRETIEAPPGHPQGALVVLPPGALVREGVQRDARRKAKLKTGTQLLAMGDEEVLGDGTRRTRVTWSIHDESCVGWVSSKNCAPLAAPPIVIDAAPPRTPPRRSTTWLDRAAAASSGSPTRTRPDALLLEGE